MTLVMSDIFVTALHPTADSNTGDDTFAEVNGIVKGIFNFNKGGDASQGFPMDKNDVGVVTRDAIANGNSKRLRVPVVNSVTISLEDADGVEFLDLLRLDVTPDPVGSVTYFATGKEPVNVSQRSSIFTFGYRVDFTITNFSSGPVLTPRHPSGKVASVDGGVMQGDNTAGTLIGKSGKDIIFGNNGDDIIVGGGNDDVLIGGKGSDIIFGGKGNDTLSGGAGKDIFVIAPNNGFDIIKDFHQGDLLGLDKSLQFNDLTILNQAKGTLVKSGNEKLAFLQGVHQLSAGDFTQIDIGNLNSRVHNDFAALSKAA